MKKICSILLCMILSVSAIFASACSGSENGIEGPYNIKIEATTGGRVSVPIEQVNFGENISISVKPNQGYRVKEFKINGEKISLVGDTYTEYCITEDLLIEVVFDSKYTTVSFDTDGRNTVRDRQFTIGSYYSSLPTATSDDPDDLFMGWYTEPGGKGSYVVNSTRVPEEAHTLYAHFITKRVVEDGSTLNAELYKEYSMTVTYFNQKATQLGLTYHTAEECYYPVIQYAEGTQDSAFFDNKENLGLIYETACSKTSTKLDWKNAGVLTELEAGKEYSLRVGDRGSGLYGEVYHFSTKSEERTQKNFFFMANTKQTESGYGDGNTAFAKTVKTATKFFPVEDTDFLIHGGDFTSSGLMPEYWEGMLGGLQDSIFEMPIVPVAGDMEYYTNVNRTTNVFDNMFHIDATSQTKTHGLYYSFNLGPVHVSVLNSNDCLEKHVNDENTAGGLITGTGSLVDQQLGWLQDDLEYTRNVNANVKWYIVVMHESLLSPAYDAPEEKPQEGEDFTKYWKSLQATHAMSLRQQLMKIFTEQKVDLVLSAQNGDSFTTNPLVYESDVKKAIAITPIEGQKKGETVYEQWIQRASTMTKEAEGDNPAQYTPFKSVSVNYNGFNVLSFKEANSDVDYDSGEQGTVFHQVGAVGLGKTQNFQYANMGDNLTKYGGIYNHLVSGIQTELVSGIQKEKELSMFSRIEIDGNTLTLRTFGVAMNEQYATVSELPYFGGVQLKKAEVIE